MTILAEIPGVPVAALADVAIRIALLLALTYGLTRCLRRSAALRHSVWMAAITLVFIVPWLPRAVPELAVASVPSLLGERYGAAPHARALPLGLTTAYRRVDRPAPEVTQAGNRPSSVESAETNPLAAILFLAWLGGAVVVCGRVVTHALRIRRITLDATESSPASQRVYRLARSASLRLGLKRPVQIMWSGDVGGPLTWGVRRAVVILPGSSVSWTDGRLCAVLRHELAHVRRMDYVALWLSHAATAAFWWHPAVWWAVRAAARERERACDDAAVHRGLSIHDYAQHLVAVAREYTIGSLRPSAAGMADGGLLQDRVRRLLNPVADRRPLTRTRIGLAWALAAGVALPLVIVQIRPQTVPVSELIAELRGGDVTSRTRAAWRLGEREDPGGVSALTAATRDSNPQVRGMAIWALGEIKDVRGLEALEHALNDADPLVREMAVLAVGELENERSILPLRVVFDEEPGLRPAVLWALEQIDNRSGGKVAQRTRGADPTVERWQDGERIRVDSEWLERTPRSAQTVPLLMRELEDPDPTVRRDAAWALGRAGATEAVDALIGALRDPDPHVRGVAVWALDEINPSRPLR